jgi:hypothetical protein
MVALLDDLIGAGNRHGRDLETERFGGFRFIAM